MNLNASCEKLPAMIRRMALFDSDEKTPAGVADLAACYEFRFDDCPIIIRVNHTCSQCYWPIDRCRPQQLYVKLSRYSAGSIVQTVALHQKIRCRPVRVAIEERTDDAAIQHSGGCLVMWLRVPLSYNLVALGEAANMQPFRIRRPTAKADAVWRILFLQRSVFTHTIYPRLAQPNN